MKRSRKPYPDEFKNHEGETINRADRQVRADEGDRRLHHAGGTQRQIDRLVGVLEPDNLLACIRDAEDNDTSFCNLCRSARPSMSTASLSVTSLT